MNSKKIFWNDEYIKKPSENLSINRYCVDLIKNGDYDLIARTYLHSKGVILGNSESLQDINQDFCKNNNYEIVYRPSGGSAILVEPDLNLCYSIFFNSEKLGAKFDIHNIYRKLTIPLAKNLGKKFSVKGNYYLRYDSNDESIPIAGHAMKSYSNIIQFDGVINLKKFDLETLENIIKLRELFTYKNVDYLKVNDKFYNLNGNQVNFDLSSAKFLKSEKQELEKTIGIENIGITQKQFKNSLKNSLENVFEDILVEKKLFIDKKIIKNYEEDFKLLNKNILGTTTKRFLGHCFVDLVEKEPLLIYPKKKI